MKAHIKFKRKLLSDNHIKIIESFFKFLQKEKPLKEDISVEFLEERQGTMTTGVRKKNDKIKVLTKDRMFVDVLRTLAHEWVHSYQHQKLNVPEDKPHQDVGGPIENQANAVAGMLLKKFTKENTKYNSIFYK